MPRLPLVEDLTTGPIPSGSALLVEFDPASHWINASITIAAAWLKQGGTVNYATMAQRPDGVRSQLKRLGVDVEAVKRGEGGELVMIDWYTATLGRKSKEKFAPPSLKAMDLGIWFSKEVMRLPIGSDPLRIVDNASTLARFNDEKVWVEILLTRAIPTASSRKVTALRGIMKGVHTEWVYKQLEGAHDGVIDFKLDETTGPPQNRIRIRNIRNVGFDGRWHPVKVNENFEATLER